MSKLFTYLTGFLIVTLFSACNTGLSFGISQRYQLEKGEWQGNRDQAQVVQQYESVINIDSLNIPLNQYILAKNYQVYIGVSFSLAADSLYQTFSHLSSHQISEYKEHADTQDMTGGILFTFVKDKQHYCAYAFDSPRDKLTYLLVLAADKETIIDKFQTAFLPTKVTL